APPHMSTREAVASVPESTSTPRGVNVPAMSTLIIAWSSRPIQRRAPTDQATRWQSARPPDLATRLTPSTAAATGARPVGGGQRGAGRGGSEGKKEDWGRRARRRGFGGTGR